MYVHPPQEIKKIFRAMACLDDQKVTLGTYMLTKDTKYWWESTHQCLVAEARLVTWDVFKEIFLEKYFPEYIRNKKEMEFLELKQWNMTM